MRTCCTATTRPDHWPVSLYASFSKLRREHQRCHKNRRRTSEEKKRKSKERLTKQGVTHRTNSVVWPSLYACAQPYYPGRYQVTVETAVSTLFGLISMALRIIVSIGYAVMRPNEAETAVHGCLIPARMIWLCACVR